MNINVQLKGASLEPGRCSGGDPGARHHHHLHTGTRDTCSRVQRRQYRNIPTQQISPVVISNYARPWPHAATRVTCTQSGGATQTLAPMIQCYPMLSTAARCGQCVQCGHDPAAVCHMSTVRSPLSVQISGCKDPLTLTAGPSDPTRGSQLRSKIV